MSDGRRPEERRPTPATIVVDTAGVVARLNLLARIVAAAEAIECGDLEEAGGLLADLERELAQAVGAAERPHICPECALPFRFPGALEMHLEVVHRLGLPDAKERPCAA